MHKKHFKIAEKVHRHIHYYEQLLLDEPDYDKALKNIVLRIVADKNLFSCLDLIFSIRQVDLIAYYVRELIAVSCQDIEYA